MASLTTPTAQPASSAHDWVRASLAQVMGLAPGSALALPGAPGGAANPAALSRFNEALNRRFERKIDPETKQIRFETVGAPLAPLAGTDTDPIIAEATRCYIGAARNATASIDSGLCLPDCCPGQIDQLLGEIRATLDRLAAAAPLSGSGVQVTMYLRELNDCPNGLLSELKDLFAGDAETSAQEHAQHAIDLAIDALNQFREKFETRTAGAQRTLADFVANVRCVAETVPIGFEALGRLLDEAGVTQCERARTDIGGDAGGTGISLADLLHMIPTECARWRELVDGERYGAAATVRGGVATVRETLLQAKASAIAHSLELDRDATAIVVSAVERCVHQATMALDTIGGHASSVRRATITMQQQAVIDADAADEIPPAEARPLTTPAPAAAPPPAPTAPTKPPRA